MFRHKPVPEASHDLMVPVPSRRQHLPLNSIAWCQATTRSTAWRVGHAAHQVAGGPSRLRPHALPPASPPRTLLARPPTCCMLLLYFCRRHHLPAPSPTRLPSGPAPTCCMPYCCRTASPTTATSQQALPWRGTQGLAYLVVYSNPIRRVDRAVLPALSSKGTREIGQSFSITT